MLAIDPENQNHMIAMLSELYYTDDGGMTWRSIENPGNSIDDYYAINKNNIIMTSSQDYIYISNDTGYTWKKSSKLFFIDKDGDTNRVNLIEKVSVNGNNIIALSSQFGTFLSTDMGVSWKQLVKNEYPKIAGDYIVEKDTIYQLERIRIRKTIDKGNSWTELSTKGLIDNYSLRKIIKNNGRLYLIAYGSKYISYDFSYSGLFLYRSSNDGANWEFLLKVDEYSWDYFLETCDSIIYLRTGDKKIIFSDNYGKSWKTIFTGAGPFLALNNQYIFFYPENKSLMRVEYSPSFSCKAEPIVITSTDENTETNSGETYPNPAEGKIIIRTSDELEFPVRIEMYNMTGEKIEHKINSYDNKKIELDVSNKKPGVYFVRYFTKSGMKVDKFIISR